MEKIIIKPTKVRAYGNIVDQKLGSDFAEYHAMLEVSEDTVNGESVTVFQISPENRVISLALISSAESCSVGDTVDFTVTATVNSEPLTGIEIKLWIDNVYHTITTNSSGIATYTYTATTSGSANCTAVYGGQSSNTISLVISDPILFFDAASSAEGLTNYGSLHKLRVTTVDGTLSYDSTMNAYKVTPTTANNDGFCDFPVPALDNKDEYYFEAEFYTTDTTTGGQPFLVIYPPDDTTGNGVVYRDIAQINRCGVMKIVNRTEAEYSGDTQKSALPVGNSWIKIRIEVRGTSVKGIWLKTDDTEVFNHTYTVPYTSGAMRVGFGGLFKSTTKPYYVRNVKAEYL